MPTKEDRARDREQEWEGDEEVIHGEHVYRGTDITDIGSKTILTALLRLIDITQGMTHIKVCNLVSFDLCVTYL